MKQAMMDYLEEHAFRYCEADFYNHPSIGRELVRFRWGNPKYKGHFKTYHGVRYFDDFIMTEIRHKIEDYNDKVKEGKLHERV